MKTKMISLISGLSLVAGLAVVPAALASNSASVTKALAGSTALDLPSKTAGLVAKASAADKQSMAIAAVKAAVTLNPSIATKIVSSVAGENPSLAPVVAVTAATLQHKQIGLITKSAVAAAPTEATKIVAAMLKEFPKDYGVIAIAASEAAPSAGREILAVVAQYVPGLQALIQGATSDNGTFPVQSVIRQATTEDLIATVPQQTLPGATPTPELSPPTVTPGGFQTFGGSPVILTSSSGTQTETGTRYAQP